MRPTAPHHDSFAGLPVDPDTPASPTRPGRIPARATLAVATGAALGAPARYGLTLLLPTTAGAFPTGTFLVNVSGSFLLGVLVVVVVDGLREGSWLSRYARPALGVGFLGAYTTYSTYAVEVDTAVRDGHIGIGAGYAAASLLAGAAATLVGMLAGRAAARSPTGETPS